MAPEDVADVERLYAEGLASGKPDDVAAREAVAAVARDLLTARQDILAQIGEPPAMGGVTNPVTQGEPASVARETLPARTMDRAAENRLARVKSDVAREYATALLESPGTAAGKIDRMAADKRATKAVLDEVSAALGTTGPVPRTKAAVVQRIRDAATAASAAVNDPMLGDRAAVMQSEGLLEFATPDGVVKQDGTVSLSGRGESMFAFAGERSKTANLKKLERAKALEKEGHSRKDIFDETGWFRDPGKNWRYEINDQYASDLNRTDSETLAIVREMIEARTGGKRDLVEHNFHHRELFEAYPQLMKIAVERVPQKGGMIAAYLRRETGFRGILRKFIGHGTDPKIQITDKADRNSLLHEIQHAIDDIEGAFDNVSATDPYHETGYARASFEQAARAVEMRSTMSPSKLAVRPPWFDWGHGEKRGGVRPKPAGSDGPQQPNEEMKPPQDRLTAGLRHNLGPELTVEEVTEMVDDAYSRAAEAFGSAMDVPVAASAGGFQRHKDFRELLRELDKLKATPEQRAAAVDVFLKEQDMMRYERRTGQQVMFAFAGEKAATADKAALKRAEEMEASGPKQGQPGYEALRTAIWNTTGWFRGTDGKWRFEIDDRGVGIRSTVEEGGQYQLDEGVRHTLLYRAYDAMRSMMLYPTAGKSGSYLNGDISVGMDGRGTDKPASIALHEMQHGIQQIEGFARGGSKMAFSAAEVAAERERLRAVQAERQDSSDWASVDTSLSVDEMSDDDIRFGLYQRLAGEVEARTVERRRNMTPAERKAIPPWVHYDVDEVQQIVRYRAVEQQRIAEEEVAAQPPPVDYGTWKRYSGIRNVLARRHARRLHETMLDPLEFELAMQELWGDGRISTADIRQVAEAYTGQPVGGLTRRAAEVAIRYEHARRRKDYALAMLSGLDPVLAGSNLDPTDALKADLMRLTERLPEGVGVHIAPVLRVSIGGARDMMAAVRAYHGSPHNFDKFSLSHIGRGEGVQAFGPGLYFTQTRSLADGYRRKLTEDAGYEVLLDGEPVGKPYQSKEERAELDRLDQRVAELEASFGPEGKDWWSRLFMEISTPEYQWDRARGFNRGEVEKALAYYVWTYVVPGKSSVAEYNATPEGMAGELVARAMQFSDAGTDPIEYAKRWAREKIKSAEDGVGEAWVWQQDIKNYYRQMVVRQKEVLQSIEDGTYTKPIPIDQVRQRFDAMKELLGAIHRINELTATKDDVRFKSKSLSRSLYTELGVYPSADKFLEDYGDQETRQEIKGLVDSGRLVWKEKVAPGALYDVSIDIADDHWLLWDRPLDQQSEYVKNALAHGGAEAIGANKKTRSLGRLRSLLQQLMPSRAAKPSRATSRFVMDESSAGAYMSDVPMAQRDEMRRMLVAAGIHGIKYLDGNSRRQGDGTYNFVVLNEDKIEITHKNGTPVSSAQRKDALAELRSPDDWTGYGEDQDGAMFALSGHRAGRTAELDGGVFRPEMAAALGVDIGANRRLIAISTASGPDVAMRTLTHEEIHALRALEVFTPQQWTSLSAIARKKPRRDEAQRILDRLLDERLIPFLDHADLRKRAGQLTMREIYRVDDRYKDYLAGQVPAHIAARGEKAAAAYIEDKIIEEVVAHAAADWADGRSYGTRIDRVMMAIRDFLESLGNFMRGNGYTNVNDIFESVWSGELVRQAGKARERAAESEAAVQEWMRENDISAMAMQPAGMMAALADRETGQSESKPRYRLVGGPGDPPEIGRARGAVKAMASQLGIGVEHASQAVAGARFYKNRPELGTPREAIKQVNAGRLDAKEELATMRREAEGQSFYYDIQNSDGRSFGSAYGWVVGNEMYFDWLGAGRHDEDGPNKLGIRVIKDLREQVRKDFPQVNRFVGYRLSGTRNKADAANRMQSVTMFAFAGERAETADKAELDRAKEMETAGKSREDIWAETGWFRGVDRKWRFEIDDSGARFSGDQKSVNDIIDATTLQDNTKEWLKSSDALSIRSRAEGYRTDLTILANRLESVLAEKNGDAVAEAYISAEIAAKRENIRLLNELDALLRGETNVRKISDRLRHDQLFASYPSLSSESLSISKVTGVSSERGSFGAGGTTLVQDLLTTADSMKSTILHELQHAIQRAEGFAQGGSVMSLSIERRRSTWEPFIRRQDELNREFDALQSERRVLIDRLSDLQMQRIKRWIPSRKLNAEIAELSGLLDAIKMRVKEVLNEQVSNTVPEYESPNMPESMSFYKALGGEVEARAVQKRMDMTADERRARPPWLDYDVPDEQQIVRFANGDTVSQKAYSSEPPVDGMRDGEDDSPGVMASLSGRLDQSPEARKARAEEMGFDTSRVWYHSQLQPKEAFEPHGKFMGRWGVSGISLTDNPEVASRYLDRYGEMGWVDGKPYQPFQKAVGAYYVRGNFKEISEPISQKLGLGFPLPENYRWPKELDGYDGVIVTDAINGKGKKVGHVDQTKKGAIVGRELILRDPKNIRSINATFDPAEEDSPNLMASLSGQGSVGNLGFNVRPAKEVVEKSRLISDRMRELHTLMPDIVKDALYDTRYNYDAALRNATEWIRILPSSRFNNVKDALEAQGIKEIAEEYAALRKRDLEIEKEIDEAHRAERLIEAAQQGRPADGPTKVYHGTDGDFEAYSGDVARSMSDVARDAGVDVVFVTPSKEFASRFGANVKVLTLDGGFYFDPWSDVDLARLAPFINAKSNAKSIWAKIDNGSVGGSTWGFLENAETISELQRLGYDGVRMSEEYYDDRDRKKTAPTYAIFSKGKLVDADSGTTMFSLSGRGSDYPTLNKAIVDLKEALGIAENGGTSRSMLGRAFRRFWTSTPDAVVTQGLRGVTIQQTTPDADGNQRTQSVRLRPRSNVQGQYDRTTGVISVRSSRDIKVIAHEGGHGLERLLGTTLDEAKVANWQELIPATDSTPPPLNPTGYAGIDLDRHEQDLLTAAASATYELRDTAQASGVSVGRRLTAGAVGAFIGGMLGAGIGTALGSEVSPIAGTGVGTVGAVVGMAVGATGRMGQVDGATRGAIAPAAVRAGEAYAELARSVGAKRAAAILDDVLAEERDDVGAYVRDRFSRTGTPRPRTMPVPDGAALSEAFARWFERYIMDPEAAQRDAPRFHEAFEDMLDAEAPGVLTAMHQVQITYRQHMADAPLTQLANEVVSRAQENAIERMAADGSFDNITGKLSTAYNAIYDDLNPIAKMVQRLLAIADRNGVRDNNGRPISLKVGEQPYKLLRMFRGSFNRGRMWLENGIADLGDTEIRGPSLRAALEMAFGGTNKDAWNKTAYAEFGAYLVARRAVAEYDRLDRKKAALANYDAVLDAAAQQRRELADTAQTERATLERRQAALIRDEARLSDAGRERRSAETAVRNIEERLRAKADDILAAQMARDSDLGLRRKREMQMLERDARRLVAEYEAVSQRVDEFDISVAMLTEEIDQRRQMSADAQARVDEMDDAVRALRAERDRTEKAGASRPPTLQPREFHERVIAEAEAKYAGAEGAGNFREAARLVHEWTHRLLTVRWQAGFLSDDLYQELSSRKDYYVPFQRDMSDANEGDVFFRGGAQKWSPFKKFDGSDRAIINPLETLSQDAYATAQQIAFNEAVESLIGLAERAGPGGGTIAERVPRSETLPVNEDTFERIRQTAIGLGIDPIDAHMIVQRMEQNFSDADVTMVWAPDNKSPITPPQLPLWVRGERQLVRLNDPAFGREVFNSINGLGEEMSILILEWMAKPARWLRAGVTTHPNFILRNLLRDIPAAYIRAGVVPFKGHAEGLRMLRNDDTEVRGTGLGRRDFVRLYNEVGGIVGGQNVASIATVDTRTDVLDLRNSSPTTTGNQTLMGRISSKVEAIETAGRLGIAAHAYRRAIEHNPSLTAIEAMQEAAFVARDVYDWSRRGSKTLALNRVITFLNAALQGTESAVRGLEAAGDRGLAMGKKDAAVLGTAMTAGVVAGGMVAGPVGVGLGGMAAAKVAEHLSIVFRKESDGQISEQEERDLAEAYKTWFRMSSVTLFFMLLYAMMRDDPWYEDIKDGTKSTHSWVRLSTLGSVMSHRIDQGADMLGIKPQKDAAAEQISKALGMLGTEWAPDWLRRYMQVPDEWRIPKPFEWALPGNIAEMIFDRLEDRDPRAAERIRASAWEVLAPPGMPQVVEMGVGIYSGYDVRKGRDIVPGNLKKLAPHQQFDAFASELAIDVSKGVYDVLGKFGVSPDRGISPKMVDWVLSNQGAYWGKDIANAWGQAKQAAGFSNREASTIYDAWVVGGVTGRGYRNSKSIEEFWKLHSEDGGKFVQAYNTYKGFLDRSGEPGKAAEFLARLDPEERAYAVLKQHFKPADERAHPIERAAAVYKINRDIRKDMILGQLTETNRRGQRDFETRIVLSPAKQTEVHDILERLSQIEVRNAMILMDREGWKGRQYLDPQPVLDELKASSPAVYEVLETKRARTRVRDWEDVKSSWPANRKELLTNGPEASLQ